MQDIETLTKRIILIGKGKILMDGSLEDIRKQFSTSKRLTVEYSGGQLHPCEGLTPVSASNQIASFVVDLNKLTVSDAITFISKQADVNDISVDGPSIDEIVAKMYLEYQI
jgi:ABC-2 type transport system ATP-binding protein